MRICCIIYLVTFFFTASHINGQTQWSLKIKSKVEQRIFKLTNKADITDQSLAGASITLYKGSNVVSQILSGASGEFEIMVPSNGEYLLTVSYPGCNTKKFAINTMNVPENIVRDSYSPSFGIEGVVMAKAFNGINYNVLNHPLVKISYHAQGKRFDDDETYTNQMLGEIGSYRNSENILIESFVSTNAAGDEALKKGDCPLAKSLYEKAMTIIAGEFYPKQQLELVGKCLKDKEAAEKAKQEAAALAKKKAEEEALAKKQAEEKAAMETKAKAEAEALAKKKAEEEALAKKQAEEKAKAEKAAADKLAAEQAVKAKEETEKLAKEQAEKAKAEKDAADKLSAEKAAKEKAEADKLAAEKAEAERIAQEKAEKQKGMKVLEAGDGGSNKTSDNVYIVPQVLGADKYKEKIKRADELFKMKRYQEAKPAYEEILKLKPNDPYCTKKLTEINQLINK